MMDSWRKLTHSAAYDSARLLKTETIAMWSLATKESYLTMGIEYVEIVGDAECGGICVDYVGEPIPLREAELGDDLPPYHPNCACSYIAYIEEVPVDEEEIQDIFALLDTFKTYNIWTNKYKIFIGTFKNNQWKNLKQGLPNYKLGGKI